MKIRTAKFIKGIRGTDPILYDDVPQIAFIGRSNVGKSSVIDSLAKTKDLVKIGKKPGKTTEINFFAINGREFYLVDLPGYGYAKVDPKEKEKIRKLILWYIMYSEVKPIKVVLVLDSKVGLTEFDQDMIQVLNEQQHPYLIVANKIDKLNQKELSQQFETIRRAAGASEVVPYSAQSKKGSDMLLSKILS